MKRTPARPTSSLRLRPMDIISELKNQNHDEKKKIHDNKKKKSSKFRNRSAIARDSETIKDNGEDGVPSKCDFKGNSGLDYVNVT